VPDARKALVPWPTDKALVPGPAHQVGAFLVGLGATHLVRSRPGPTHHVGPFLVGLRATHLVRSRPGPTHHIGTFLIRLGATHGVRTLARRASCHVSLLRQPPVQRYARV